jgi:hypothetical protein
MVRELALQHSVNESTVKRRLRPIVENFECREWGVTVLKDFLTEKILCRKYVRRYLTRNPKPKTGRELWILVKKTTKLAENEFIACFQKWENRWILFFEGTDKRWRNGEKPFYTHKVAQCTVEYPKTFAVSVCFRES